MSNKNSGKKQLKDEVIELRQRLAELEEVDIIRKEAEKRREDADKKYRLFFENAIDAIFIIDQGSEKILDCNKKAADVSGYTVRELKTMRVTELYPPEEQDVVSKIFGKVAERGTLSGISGISLLRKDGKCVPVEINAATHEFEGEKCICGITRDITLRKKTEDLLRESEEKTRAMLNTSLDAIMMMDEKGTISYFNKAAEKIFGFRQKEVKGKKLHDILASENARKKYYQNLPKFEQSGQCAVIGKTLELYASRKDGTRFPIEISISSFHLQGKWHSVGSIRDITSRKEMEKKLRESSMTDELTGLFNRRGFLELSSQQFRLSNRKKSGLYLLLLEVDNLRAINEKYGHKTGDQILQDTAKLLKSTFRESDIISRIGGNEFSVLLVTTQEPATEKILNSHIEDNLKAYHKQKDRGYELLLNLGISHYDPDLPCSLDELLTRAGALMNKNKPLKPAISGEAIKEKRQHERFSNGHILKGEFDVAGEVFIKNISLGGICLRTSRMLPPHTTYKVNLMDDMLHKQINLTGRVVWSVAVKARREIVLPSYEAGLQFIDVKNSLKKSLKEITSRFKA